MADEPPSADRVQDRARERQHERAERVEDVLAPVAELLGEHKYPATSEELAVEYGDQEIDLPNETEALGSVLDRLVDERFDSADEAVEAVYDELTGEAAGPEEYNDQRDLARLREDGEPMAGEEPLGTGDPTPEERAAGADAATDDREPPERS